MVFNCKEMYRMVHSVQNNQLLIIESPRCTETDNKDQPTLSAYQAASFETEEIFLLFPLLCHDGTRPTFLLLLRLSFAYTLKIILNTVSIYFIGLSCLF